MKYNFEKLGKGIKAKWLKALRSGDYLQGRGQLKEIDGGVANFCCLGVLAEVCGVSNLGSAGFILKGTGMRGISNYPKQLVGSEGLPEKLADFNDENKWSFKKIASWVEKYL